MWYNVSSTIGCGSAMSDATSVLSCMRTANSSLILAAVARLAATSSNTAALPNTFTPTIDSTVVFSDYPSRSLSGNFIKVPILMGNNDNEAGIFRVGDILSGNYYPPAYYNTFNLKKFVCPCANRANVSVYNKVSTWRYRWFGVYQNTNLTSSPDSGAYHGSEIPIIFNTMPAGKGNVNSTLQETAVSSYMMGAWATFAKDPANGLESYQGGWPEYDPTESTLLRLSFNNTAGTFLAMPSEYDSECATQFTITGTTENGTATGPENTSTSTNTGTPKSAGTRLVFSSSWMRLAAIVAIVSFL
jgi:carboxylesterase type B